MAFDPRELVAALAAAEIDYVVIGGFAVGAHGQDLEDLQRLGA